MFQLFWSNIFICQNSERIRPVELWRILISSVPYCGVQDIPHAIIEHDADKNEPWTCYTNEWIENQLGHEVVRDEWFASNTVYGLQSS